MGREDRGEAGLPPDMDGVRLADNVFTRERIFR